MNYYPVCIPTLCRYQHFTKCIESLLACPESQKTELIVSVDFPQSEKHIEGRQKIIDYLKGLVGFKDVKLFIQDKNLGARDNWIFVREYAFEKYGAAIMTEDDNEFAPSFLDYMNKALEYYWENDKVMSISAYSSLGCEDAPEPFFFSYSECAWGIGLWRHKIYGNYHDISLYSNILNNTKDSLKIYWRAPFVLDGIMNIVKKGEVFGDYALSANNIINSKYQLRPRNSLVINCGQDGSGLHSGVNNEFNYLLSKRGLPEEISFNYDFSLIKVEPSGFVNRYWFWRYGGFGKFHIIPQIKVLVKYMIFRLRKRNE